MSLLQLFLKIAIPALFVASAISGAAQNEKPKPFELTDAEVKKLSRASVDLITSKLPGQRIYIYKLEKDSVGLLVPPRRTLEMQPTTIKKTYAYKDISKIVVTNPKRKRKLGWISSAIGLAAGVGLGLMIREDDPQSDVLTPLGQTTAPSVFEPIIGGLLGWTIGKTVGETMSRVKLHPSDRNFKKRMRELNPHVH